MKKPIDWDRTLAQARELGLTNPNKIKAKMFEHAVLVIETSGFIHYSETVSLTMIELIDRGLSMEIGYDDTTWLNFFLELFNIQKDDLASILTEEYLIANVRNMAEVRFLNVKFLCFELPT